jgi:hypothetical protein
LGCGIDGYVEDGGGFDHFLGGEDAGVVRMRWKGDGRRGQTLSHIPRLQCGISLECRRYWERVNIISRVL